MLGGSESFNSESPYPGHRTDTDMHIQHIYNYNIKIYCANCIYIIAAYFNK